MKPERRYWYRESIGDYNVEYGGFRTTQEMCRHQEKRIDGLWYDWDLGESI